MLVNQLRLTVYSRKIVIICSFLRASAVEGLKVRCWAINFNDRLPSPPVKTICTLLGKHVQLVRRKMGRFIWNFA